jgi:sec-independent protein translocase protein TatB
MLAALNVFDGSELLIVVAIVGALLVFGPEKIPEMARQIGRVRAELDKATSEARNMMDTAMKEAEKGSSGATSSLGATMHDMTVPFESAAKELKSSFDDVVKSAQASASTVGSQPAAVSPANPPSLAPLAPASAPEMAAAPPTRTEGVDADALIGLAHRIGISTSGKTREEISDEIFSMAGTKDKPATS